MTSKQTSKAVAALTAQLLEHLERGGGLHRYANYHAEIERERGSLEIGQINGSVLQSEDADEKAKGSPFDTGLAFDKLLNEVIKATDKTEPLRLVDYAFVRNDAGWQQRRLLQTIEAHDALEEARRGLDKQLVALLAEQCRAATAEVSLERRRTRPDVELVLVSKAGKASRPELPDGLRNLYQEYEGFYADRGFRMIELVATMDARRLKRVDVDLSYGLPLDSATATER